MADWLGINSSHLLAGGAGVAFCGEDEGYPLTNALDGINSAWFHTAVETHYFIINLGAPYNITAVRARSLTSRDPTNVNIYVSDDTGDWGVAVASGITTWQDRDDWDGTAVISTTPKNGQYIKVEIVSTEPLGNLRFGAGTAPYFIIFDAYGEVAPILVYPDALSLELTLQAISITAIQNRLITPSALALELSLLAPTYFSGALITPAALALELSLQAPSVLLNFDAAITPATLALQLSLKDPAVGIVFHSLVTPSTLALQLSLPVPVYGGVLSLVEIDLLTLEITLRQPVAGPMFPTLSTSPSLQQYTDEFDESTILKDSYASGYPLLNPQYDFDPKHFRHTLRNISQADKILLMNFYEGNKESEVFWLNEQDGSIYVVMFMSKPFCELDASKNEHRIELDLKQAVEL